ncbi:hypothetical protein L1887_25227 [Cichorium endivia]|nr:hypothetical protein L1887_25227 [Cichorium endivia]
MDEMVGFLKSKQGTLVNIRELVFASTLGTTPNIADFYPKFKGLDPQGLKRKTLDAMNEAFSAWEHIINERRATREMLSNQSANFQTLFPRIDTTGRTNGFVSHFFHRRTGTCRFCHCIMQLRWRQDGGSGGEINSRD